MIKIDLSQDLDLSDPDVAAAYGVANKRACKIDQEISDECFLVHDPIRMADLLHELMTLYGFTAEEMMAFSSRFDFACGPGRTLSTGLSGRGVGQVPRCIY